MCFMPGGCRNRIIACRAKCFWSTVDPALGIDRKTKPRSAKHITAYILPADDGSRPSRPRGFGFSSTVEFLPNPPGWAVGFAEKNRHQVPNFPPQMASIDPAVR